MKKWQLVLFYISTFSIGYFYIKNKAKKESEVKNDEIQVSNKIPFDIQSLISYLGEKENIINTSSTISSLKVEVKDIKRVDLDKIKSLKAKGVMKSGKKISMVFGDFSRTLDDEISKIINSK